MNYQSKNKQLGFDEVVAKLMKYCAYQERSTLEVLSKARTFKLTKAQIDSAIEILIKDDFLNEERFCRAFVKGKLNIKKWGPYKIRSALAEKGVSLNKCDDFINEIDSANFENNLSYWLDYRLRKEEINRINFDKHYRFLISKGFENDQVYQKLKSMI